MFTFIEKFKTGKLIYGHKSQESGYLWGEERASYLEGAWVGSGDVLFLDLDGGS